MESVVDVIIDPKGSVSGGNTVNRVVDGVKANFLDLAAKVFVVQQAITKVWSLASKGADFEETMTRLNRQMSQFQLNATLMVGGMVSVSNGVLSVERAATLASRALAIGMNPDQINTFVKAADSLEDVMGTDLPSAFEELIQAAITGRGKVLANIGVFVDLEEETKKLAVATGRTTEQISNQEKVMLTAKAITEQAGDALHKLSDGAISDADRLKQVEAKWDNLWLTIGQGAKTATVTALEWIGKLAEEMKKDKYIPGMSLFRQVEKNAPGSPANPKTQEILGQAITQDTLGNLQRKRDAFALSAGNRIPATEAKTLVATRLDAQNDRVNKGLEGDLERTRATFEQLAKLYEEDARLQLMTQVELTTAKGELAVREVESVRDKLRKELAQENQFNKDKIKNGFESTQDKITEEERHKTKVFEINQAIKANAVDLSHAILDAEIGTTKARGEAEEALGKRKIEIAQSTYAIEQEIRNRASADSEIYWQGEFAMADANMKSDQEIAQMERAQLREQLAFKLKLTQEETDRLLFFRKAQDFDGVRQIAGRADPELSPERVEGLVESANAKDMKAAERANNDFFASWNRGLKNYSQNRDSVFGMSADMARRTAQAMESGFQKFFFDAMEGKFTSFKDVLNSVLDFTKQIIAQMVAQLTTMAVIGAVTGGVGGGAGGAADSNWLGVFGQPRGFASGGSFTVAGSGGTDSVPVGFMATPGETVSVRTPGQQGGGGVAINIAVNVGRSSEQSSTGASDQKFSSLARDLSKMVEAKLIEEKRPGGLLAGV